LASSMKIPFWILHQKEIPTKDVNPAKLWRLGVGLSTTQIIRWQYVSIVG
jgi:hypothetical protein